MERLPDRADAMRNESPAANTDAGNTKKQSKKDKFKTYSFLILIVVLLFILMQKNEVPLDHIAVNDCRYDEARTSYFVASTLLEGEKFAKAQVIFNEESGIAEITLYKYTTPTFLGTRNFVAMIDTTTADIKEIWLKTETGKLQVKGFTAACFFVRSVGHSYRLLPTTAPSHKRTRCSPTPENIAHRLCRAF